MKKSLTKKKVETYFAFFKKFNPFFKDINLSIDTIDDFEFSIKEQTEEAENHKEVDIQASDQSSTSGDDSSTDFISSEYSNVIQSELINDDILDEKYLFKDQTTVLSDKYEADIKGTTVCNRLANVIVRMEASNSGISS